MQEDKKEENNRVRNYIVHVKVEVGCKRRGTFENYLKLTLTVYSENRYR